MRTIKHLIDGDYDFDSVALKYRRLYFLNDLGDTLIFTHTILDSSIYLPQLLIQMKGSLGKRYDKEIIQYVYVVITVIRKWYDYTTFMRNTIGSALEIAFVSIHLLHVSPAYTRLCARTVRAVNGFLINIFAFRETSEYLRTRLS